jgi:hypothetical protein
VIFFGIGAPLKFARAGLRFMRFRGPIGSF